MAAFKVNRPAAFAPALHPHTAVFASISGARNCQVVLIYAFLHAGPSLAPMRMPAWLARSYLHQRMALPSFVADTVRYKGTIIETQSSSG